MRPVGPGSLRLYFANPLVGLLWIEDAKVGALAFN